MLANVIKEARAMGGRAYKGGNVIEKAITIYDARAKKSLTIENEKQATALYNAVNYQKFELEKSTIMQQANVLDVEDFDRYCEALTRLVIKEFFDNIGENLQQFSNRFRVLA